MINLTYLPYRKIPLINDEIYHVFNRGFLKRKIFLNDQDYSRIFKTLSYYQYSLPPVKFSYFQQRTIKEQEELLASFKKYNQPGIQIFAYCFMPNHFHLLIKQIKDSHLLNSLSKLSNSYSKYFNLKHERQGPVFQGRFQAVRIISQEQFLHVNRYIHLNPYTASLVKSFPELIDYPYSSLKEYLHPDQSNICQTSEILDQFESIQKYQEFILDQADYQQKLHLLKHVTTPEW